MSDIYDCMEDILKTCYKCRFPKSLLAFNKCKSGTFGVHGHCRECQKEIRKTFYKQKEQPTKYWLTPERREYSRTSSHEKYHNDPLWKQKHLEDNKIRRRQEPAKIKARLQRKRWYNIPKNRIACSLRVRLRKAIQKGIKIDTTEKLLGCSFDKAKQHLEDRFCRGMKWENYGRWHIDHIVPCSFFDLTDAYQQRMCFNYRNLQPMWAKENISKCNRVSVNEIAQTLKELELIGEST